MNLRKLYREVDRIDRTKRQIQKVRRTMPNIIAHEIVGVSPMTGSTQGVFGMRAKYVTRVSAGSGTAQIVLQAI